MRSGGDSRVAGVLLALATFGVLVIGPVLIGFIPIMVVGALIFFLGFDLMREALVDTWGRVHHLEYLTAGPSLPYLHKHVLTEYRSSSLSLPWGHTTLWSASWPVLSLPASALCFRARKYPLLEGYYLRTQIHAESLALLCGDTPFNIVSWKKSAIRFM